MALFAWNDAYSVHVRQFDEQHKKLFDLINKLHDAMKNGKGMQVVGEILGSLVAYTQAHFSDEERLMVHHGYPGFVNHKKTHDQLVSQVRDFQKQFQTGDATVSTGVMVFLKDWLVQHIQGMDTKYGPFMNGKGVA